MKLTPLCMKMKDISKVATPVWVKDIYKVSRDTDSTNQKRIQGNNGHPRRYHGYDGHSGPSYIRHSGGSAHYEQT